MTGQKIDVPEVRFILYPGTFELWQVANDLRGDFAPATVTAYLSQIVTRERFRVMYQTFMEFADAAHLARQQQVKDDQ